MYQLFYDTPQLPVSYTRYVQHRKYTYVYRKAKNNIQRSRERAEERGRGGGRGGGAEKYYNLVRQQNEYHKPGIRYRTSSALNANIRLCTEGLYMITRHCIPPASSTTDTRYDTTVQERKGKQLHHGFGGS